MADSSPELQGVAEAGSGSDIQRTTTAEWVLAARILAGGPLLYYGVTQSMSPALMRDMLQAAQVPQYALLGLALPVAQALTGLVLLAGAYARPAALAGMGLAGMLGWLVWTCISLREGYLPPGIEAPPPTPALPMPILIFAANLVIAIKGAGPLSIDDQMTRAEPPPPPPEDPDAPPTGIV